MIVLKWPLEASTASQSVRLPADARILHVNVDGGDWQAERPPMVCLWTLSDRKEPEVERTFVIAGTGDVLHAGWRYVGTAKHVGPDVLGIGAGQVLFWHVFELVPG